MIKFNPFDTFYKYKLNITDEQINQIKILIQNNFTTYNKLNVLNFPLLFDLKKQVINILNDHNIFLDHNWAQLYNKSNNHGVHTHPYSVLSGIIYLTSEGTPTTFYDRVFNEYQNPVEKNTLVLFPSYIPHEVKTLKTNENRLIISLNTKK